MPRQIANAGRRPPSSRVADISGVRWPERPRGTTAGEARSGLGGGGSAAGAGDSPTWKPPPGSAVLARWGPNSHSKLFSA